MTIGTFRHVIVTKEMIGKHVLLPEHELGHRAIKTIKLDKVGIADTYTKRNPIHLRKYWAMIAVVAEAKGIEDPEELSKDLLKELGFGKWVMDKWGDWSFREESIALVTGMSQERFDKFYKAADLKMLEYLGIIGDQDAIDEYERIKAGRGQYNDGGAFNPD